MSSLALENLIKRYTDAQNAWRAKDAIDDRPGSNPVEWRAYMDTSFQIIEHRCSSLEEVSQKAASIASDECLFDTVQNGCDGEALKLLLLSMVIDIKEEQA
ncbi:UNVERIFIED_ORG: thymidine kinase [Agrobacterium larrymoorei]|nr:thymidine kinase [Agrobacterium larrymoorei]